MSQFSLSPYWYSPHHFVQSPHSNLPPFPTIFYSPTYCFLFISRSSGICSPLSLIYIYIMQGSYIPPLLQQQNKGLYLSNTVSQHPAYNHLSIYLSSLFAFCFLFFLICKVTDDFTIDGGMIKAPSVHWVKQLVLEQSAVQTMPKLMVKHDVTL